MTTHDSIISRTLFFRHGTGKINTSRVSMRMVRECRGLSCLTGYVTFVIEVYNL